MPPVVDIYMPDIKYLDSTVGLRLSGIEAYAQTVKPAVSEMYRQVGNLQLDEMGTAMRGILIRHLVLPNGLSQSREVVDFICDGLSKDTCVNIMD